MNNKFDDIIESDKAAEKLNDRVSAERFLVAINELKDSIQELNDRNLIPTGVIQFMDHTQPEKKQSVIFEGLYNFYACISSIYKRESVFSVFDNLDKIKVKDES